MSRTLSCIALLTLSGCGMLYDDTCGAEFRSVESSAPIFTAQGDTMGYVAVHLEESKDDYGRSVSWLIVGEPLRGKLDAARLVASEDTANVLFPLPGEPAEPDIIVDGELHPYTGPVDYNVLFNRARLGRLTVLLETSLPGRPIIALPLHVETFLDWGKPHCS
jgi:hypothetical protein